MCSHTPPRLHLGHSTARMSQLSQRKQTSARPIPPVEFSALFTRALCGNFEHVKPDLALSHPGTARTHGNPGPPNPTILPSPHPILPPCFYHNPLPPSPLKPHPPPQCPEQDTSIPPRRPSIQQPESICAGQAAGTKTDGIWEFSDK